MAAASTLSSLAYIFKRKYSGSAVGDLAMRAHPTVSKMRKEGGMDGLGAGWFYGIRYGNPQGISGTFSSAQSAASASKGVQLVATRRKKYGIITLDGEALVAARSREGALLDLVSQETDGVVEEHGDALSFEAFRDGSGARGRRSSANSNVITLTVADDARNFKVGMTVVADDTADGSSLRTGSTTVAAVNEDAGTITLTNAASIDSFSDSDYLFRIGDPGTIVDGFASHLPLTAPSSGETFRGIDRSVDTRRLAGVRIDDTATSIEENAGLVAVKISQVGKKADTLVLNPINFWACVRRLNAKVEYDGGGSSAGFGFEHFMIHTPAGALKAFSDPDCPTSRGYVLNMSTWYWKTLEEWCHIIREGNGGAPQMRIYNEDAVEVRTRSMGNICCSEPGSNGVFSI